VLIVWVLIYRLGSSTGSGPCGSWTEKPRPAGEAPGRFRLVIPVVAWLRGRSCRQFL